MQICPMHILLALYGTLFTHTRQYYWTTIALPRFTFLKPKGNTEILSSLSNNLWLTTIEEFQRQQVVVKY